mgnify:FL=1
MIIGSWLPPLSHVSVITIKPIFLAMIVSQSTAVFLDKERAFHRVNVESVNFVVNHFFPALLSLE